MLLGDISVVLAKLAAALDLKVEGGESGAAESGGRNGGAGNGTRLAFNHGGAYDSDGSLGPASPVRTQRRRGRKRGREGVAVGHPPLAFAANLIDRDLLGRLDDYDDMVDAGSDNGSDGGNSELLPWLELSIDEDGHLTHVVHDDSGAGEAGRAAGWAGRSDAFVVGASATHTRSDPFGGGGGDGDGDGDGSGSGSGSDGGVNDMDAVPTFDSGGGLTLRFAGRL